jgi:hypothetical protein
MSLAKAAVRVGVLSAALVALAVQAPAANAAPDNNSFCNQLAALGYPGQCTTIVALAKGVCAQYDRGVDWSTVVKQVDTKTNDEGLSNYIMAGAPMYFCPQHQDMSP